LTAAWEAATEGRRKKPNVLTFVALGGEGKTSLVARWAVDLEVKHWPECEAAFAWSFYSQGTREQIAASSDLFLKESLTFFGDAETANSNESAFDKGRRLARLVGEQRALLILDGLETLQYAPTAPTPGELKDHGIGALLKGLAATNRGLCVVTTRYSIPDLRAYWQTTAPEVKLLRLSKQAGVDLLRLLGVKGTQKEFEALVEEVQGHALTLNLLGSYLHDAHVGDIRKRDLVKLEEADAEEQGGHAFRVMDAYVRWFESEGDKGKRALAVLRLLGLFDRPATADCLTALLNMPAIPDLTESVVGISEAQRNVALSRLEAAKLLTANRDAAGTLFSLDTHALLREYFSIRLRTQHSEAWRAAHGRLYKHLCVITKDIDKPTLEDLQPLYQAVAHGCQAGRQHEALEEVYLNRICRREEYYSSTKLGAFGADLGAIACFFETPWRRLSPSLTEVRQALLLNQAAFCLVALGRLTEALEPTRAGLEIFVKLENWMSAAATASNLSELELTMGEVAGGVGHAEQSVTYADRSGPIAQGWHIRELHAKALHQAGRRADAETRFREAEALMAERLPSHPLLYSTGGFWYCDLLLAASKRAAWQLTLHSSFRGHPSSLLAAFRHWAWLLLRRLPFIRHPSSLPAACLAVGQRAAQTIKIAEENKWLLNIALDNLTLARAALYEAILKGTSLKPCHSSLQHAMDGLRRAGQSSHLPQGFLTRAWLRALEGDTAGARTDLDEAWQIAERGPMRLHMADIHLHRARLFHDKEDLEKARALIERCGYWRHKEEFEDAEIAARAW
jgi:tetratricopeptide (TPR) repeat protein